MRKQLKMMGMENIMLINTPEESKYCSESDRYCLKEKIPCLQILEKMELTG